MVKITGAQSIPSVLLDVYRGTLTEKQPDGVSRKRYPYRVPNMQEGGSGVKPGQLAQRTRFKESIANFKKESAGEKERWYAARPEWSSLLWYYNYYIMSDLTGNANSDAGGVGVIKSIQVVKQSVPTTGGQSFAIDAVDPAKTVVMMFGNSFISDSIQHHSGVDLDGTDIEIPLDPEIDPSIAEIKMTSQSGRMDISGDTGDGQWGSWYVVSVAAALLVIRLLAGAAHTTAGWSLDIIEHKAQTIYPVLVSIAAEAVVIDWAKVPSIVADVSLIVIEYI